MTISLTYVSQARAHLDEAQLKVLVEAARKRNGQMNVTGALAYSNGWFIQVLEGDALDVKSLYSTIAKDTRHINLTIIVEREIAARAFGDWSMAMIACEQSENDTLRNVYQIARRAQESEKFDSLEAFHTFIAPPRLAVQGSF